MSPTGPRSARLPLALSPVLSSRRGLLLGSVAALGALAGCTDSSRAGTPASSPRPSDTPRTPRTPQEAAIFDLSFTTVDRFRPVELVAPGFVAVTADRGPTDDPQADLRREEAGPPAPFAAVEVRASSDPGSDGGSDGPTPGRSPPDSRPTTTSTCWCAGRPRPAS